MYDKDFVLNGINEISDFIGKLLSDDPNFQFTEARPMEAVQNGIRFYGKIQMGEKKEIVSSMDFFILNNEKVMLLYVFM